MKVVIIRIQISNITTHNSHEPVVGQPIVAVVSPAKPEEQSLGLFVPEAG